MPSCFKEPMQVGGEGQAEFAAPAGGWGRGWGAGCGRAERGKGEPGDWAPELVESRVVTVWARQKALQSNGEGGPWRQRGQCEQKPPSPPPGCAAVWQEFTAVEHEVEAGSEELSGGEGGRHCGGLCSVWAEELGLRVWVLGSHSKARERAEARSAWALRRGGLKGQWEAGRPQK